MFILPLTSKFLETSVGIVMFISFVYGLNRYTREINSVVCFQVKDGYCLISILFQY